MGECEEKFLNTMLFNDLANEKNNDALFLIFVNTKQNEKFQPFKNEYLLLFTDGNTYKENICRWSFSTNYFGGCKRLF